MIRSKAPTNRRYSLPPYVHSERVQHLGRGSEPDHLALLLHGQRRQEDRHDSVLAERNPRIPDAR